MSDATDRQELIIDQSTVAPEASCVKETMPVEEKIAADAVESMTTVDKEPVPDAEKSKDTKMIEVTNEGQKAIADRPLTVSQGEEEPVQDTRKSEPVQSNLQPTEEKAPNISEMNDQEGPVKEPMNDQVSQCIDGDSVEMTSSPPVISEHATDKLEPLKDTLEITKENVSEHVKEDTVHAICSEAVHEIVDAAVRATREYSANQTVSVSVTEHVTEECQTDQPCTVAASEDSVDERNTESLAIEPVNETEELHAEMSVVEKVGSDVVSQDKFSNSEKDVSVSVVGDVPDEDGEEDTEEKAGGKSENFASGVLPSRLEQEPPCEVDEKDDVPVIKGLVSSEATKLYASGNDKMSPHSMQATEGYKDNKQKEEEKVLEARQEIDSKKNETDDNLKKDEDMKEKDIPDINLSSSNSDANVEYKDETKADADLGVFEQLPAKDHVKDSLKQETSIDTTPNEEETDELPATAKDQIGSKSSETLPNRLENDETEVTEASDKVVDESSTSTSNAAKVPVAGEQSVLQGSPKVSPTKRKYRRRGRGKRRPETERLQNPDPPSRKRKYESANKELDDKGAAKQTLLEDDKAEPSPAVSESVTSKSPTAMIHGPTKMTTRGKKNRYWYKFAKQKRPKRESAEQKKLAALQKAEEPELEKAVDANKSAEVGEAAEVEQVLQSKPTDSVPQETQEVKANNIDEMLAECKPCSVVLVDFIRCLDLSRIQTLMTPGESTSYSSSQEDSVDTEDEPIDSPPTESTATPIATQQDTTAEKMPQLPPKPITSSSAFERQFLSFIEEPSKKNVSDQKSQVSLESVKAVAPEINTSKPSEEPVKEKPVEPMNMNTNTTQVPVHADVKVPDAPTLITKKPIGSYSAPKFICLHCTYTTNIRSTMTDHIYNHTDVIPYKCGMCGSIFTTRSGVLVHTRREHNGCTPAVIKTDEIREEDYYTTYEEVHSLYQPSSSSRKAGVQTVAKVADKKSETSQHAAEKGVSKRRLPGRVASSKQTPPQTLCSLLASAPKTATPPLSVNQSVLPNEQKETTIDAAKPQAKSVEGESGVETGTADIVPTRHSHRKRSRSKSPTRRVRHKTSNSDNGGRSSPSSRKGTMRPRIPNLDTADPTLPYYQCRHCTYSTNSCNHIKQHVEIKHKEEQRYTCPLCDLAYFKYEDGVRRHFQKTHPGQPVILLLQPDFYDVNEQSSFTRQMTEATVRTMLPDAHEKKKSSGQKLVPGGESLLKPSVAAKRDATSPGLLTAPSSGSVSPAPPSVSPVRPVTPIILRIPTIYPRSTTPGSRSDLSSPRSLNEEAISKSQTDNVSSMTEASDRPKSVPPSIKIAKTYDGTDHQGSTTKEIGPTEETKALSDEGPPHRPGDVPVLSSQGLSNDTEGASAEDASQMEVDTQKTDSVSTMQMSTKGANQVSCEGVPVVEKPSAGDMAMETESDVPDAEDEASSQTEGTAADITASAGSPVDALDLSVKPQKEITEKTLVVPVPTTTVDGTGDESQVKQQDYMCKEVSSTSEVQEKSGNGKMVAATGPSVAKVPMDTDSVAAGKTSEKSLAASIVHVPSGANSDIIDGDNDSGLKIVNVMSLQGTVLAPEKPTQPPTLPRASPTQGNYLYQCKKCQISTPILDDIVNHIDVAHKLEYWYACPYCPFGCSRLKANMFRHIKRQHPQADDNVALGLLDQEKYFRKLPMGGGVLSGVSPVRTLQGASVPAGASVTNVPLGRQTVTTPSGAAMAKTLPRNTARKSMIPPGRLKQMADHLRKTLPQSVFKAKLDKPNDSDTDKNKSSPDEDVIIVGEEMAKRTATIHRTVASPLHMVKSTIPTRTISPQKGLQSIQRSGQAVRTSHTQSRASNEGSLYMDCEAGEETQPHDDSVIDEDVIIHENQPVTIITPRELPQDSSAVGQMSSPNAGQNRTLIIPGQQQETQVVNVQPVSSSSTVQQTIVNRPPSIMPPRLSAHSRPGAMVRHAAPHQTNVQSPSNARASPAPPAEVTPIIIAPPNVTVSGSVMPRPPPPLIPSNMPAKPPVSMPRTMQAPPLLRAPMVTGQASGGILSRPMSQPRLSPSVASGRPQDSARPPPARLTPAPVAPKPVINDDKDLDEEEMSKEAFNVFNLAPRPLRPTVPSPALAAAARWSEKWSQRMPGPGFLGARQFEPRHPPPPYPGILPGQGFHLGPRSFGPMQMRPHRMQAQGQRPMNTGPQRPGMVSGGVLSCPYCNHKATDGDSLHNHILSHAPNIQWTCPYCPSPNQMPKHAVSNHITGRHPGCQVVYIPYGVPL